MKLKEFNSHFQCVQIALFTFIFFISLANNSRDFGDVFPASSLSKILEGQQQKTDKIMPAKGAHIISFKLIDQRPKLSERYDGTLRDVSYIDQCYSNVTRIGGGMFSKVFSAISLDDGRAYAIKSAPILHELGENKYHEVERWEPLSDLNIVQYVKAWEEDSTLNIEAELCLGNLEQLRNSRSFTSTDLWFWHAMIDVLFALKHLAEHNLTHCDIKLSNFMDDHKMAEWICDVMLPGFYWKHIEEVSKNCSHSLTPDVDVASAGLLLLELAIGQNGYNSLDNAQKLREICKLLSSGHFDDTVEPLYRSYLIRMLEPDPTKRPTAAQLLILLQSDINLLEKTI